MSDPSETSTMNFSPSADLLKELAGESVDTSGTTATVDITDTSETGDTTRNHETETAIEQAATIPSKPDPSTPPKTNPNDAAGDDVIAGDFTDVEGVATAVKPEASEVPQASPASDQTITQADDETTANQASGAGDHADLNINLEAPALSAEASEMAAGTVSQQNDLPQATAQVVATLTSSTTQTNHKQDTTHNENQSGSLSVYPSILVRPLRVLVVDDSETLRVLIERVLSKAGAQVSLANDGIEALETVLGAGRTGCCFDVILMDMNMPKLNGCNAVNALRATGYQGAIIALTANTEQYDIDRCIQAGCNDYAAKPIRPRQLIEMLLRVI